MSNEDYKQQFDALWDTVVQFGGSVTNHPNLINARATEIAKENNHVDSNGDTQADIADIRAATKDVDDRMRACYMLGGGEQ